MGERGIAIENLKKLVGTTSFDVVMGYYCKINQVVDSTPLRWSVLKLFRKVCIIKIYITSLT